MKLNKDNMIITIDTELGSNGEAVARELAAMLHLPCYGTEILDKAAELSGIPARLMHHYDGHAVRAAYDLLADDHSPLKIRPAADFITAQVAACHALAAEGSCILVDRHATMALEGTEGHVSIYIHSDFADRAARMAEEKGIAIAEAEKALKKADRAYRSYYRGNRRSWGEADSYDISVNASDADAHALALTVLGFLETAAGTQLAEREVRKAM